MNSDATPVPESWLVYWLQLKCAATDQSYGKSALMKALLHLKDGKNETVELLIHISEEMGDLKKFVNLAFTSAYYKGDLCTRMCFSLISVWLMSWYGLLCNSDRADGTTRGHREEKSFLCEAAGQ